MSSQAFFFFREVFYFIDVFITLLHLTSRVSMCRISVYCHIFLWLLKGIFFLFLLQSVVNIICNRLSKKFVHYNRAHKLEILGYGDSEIMGERVRRY